LPVPVIFAFGFANGALLAGMAAAGIPILIHLLNRRRFREEPWAAMRFLIAAIRKNQRRIRIEQILLLAVRTLLIVLLVAAMARPFLEGLGAVPIFAGRRTHRVIAIDGSLSMSYAPTDASRFQQATKLADRLVRDSRRGDAISLVILGDPPRVVIGDPSPNHDEVRKEIGGLSPTHGRIDLEASFLAIDRVLAASDIDQKEVVVVTDLQANSWRPEGPGGAGAPGGPDDGLRRALAKLQARKARSVVIDLGSDSSENSAVVDLRLDAPVVAVGGPAPVVQATLRRFGRDPAVGARARLVVDGRLGPEWTGDLPPGEDVPIAFRWAFDSPGDHVVEVRLDADALPVDDARRLVVPVREQVRVLLVDGDYKSEAFAAETDYLSVALSPPEGTDAPGSIIRPDVVAESQFARRDLSPYDVVALANVAQFTEAEAASLSAFLEQGGGVVFFLGDRVLPDNYNRVLFADGKGPLPASIGDGVGDADRTEGSAFEFDPLGFRHPIVADFENAPDAVLAGLTAVKTWRYRKLTMPPGSTAAVALAYSTGDPAIVEAPRGRGRALVVSTTADAGWSSWPLHPSYPAVMEQLILQAAAGRLAGRNVRVGQPIDQALPASALDAPVTVVAPGGESTPLKLRADGDVARLHYEGTDLAGVYQARLGPPVAANSSFAANPDPAESDPARLDQTGLREALPGWSFAYLDDGQSLIPDAAAVGRRGELHRHLLYAVLALILIESLLAWRFGHH